MTTDILIKLFSSGALVKMMRLFLFNPDTPYDINDVTNRTKSQKKDVRYEAKLLQDIGFLKHKVFYKDLEEKKTKKSSKKKTTHFAKAKPRQKKKKVHGWVLNTSFGYLSQLRALLVNERLLDDVEMKKRLKKIGKVKIVLATGVFVQDYDTRLDLLVVADKVKLSVLHSIVRDLEVLLGSELRYTLLTSEDFRYRMSVRDRLLRDIFENEHTIVINTYKNFSLPKDGTL